jgi:hypothetical protein
VLALDALERKQGMASNRNTNEKITDGARNAFEKVTGCAWSFIQAIVV